LLDLWYIYIFIPVDILIVA